MAVERDPLVYALKIAHVWSKLRERFPGFPDWECRPGSAWNLALCLALEASPAPESPVVVRKDPSAGSHFTVTHPAVPHDANPWESAPIELVCYARRVKGSELLPGDVTPDVPQSPVATDSLEERITLVPYGCTRIRITHFPVAAMGDHRPATSPSRRPGRPVRRHVGSRLSDARRTVRLEESPVHSPTMSSSPLCAPLRCGRNGVRMPA